MEMNKKQTAVNWLINQLRERGYAGELPPHLLFDQAKAIEKEQMWEYIKKQYCIGEKSLSYHREEFEKYYNETYGQ
jgi:hypothetical protein